jgi:hypothetical protein
MCGGCSLALPGRSNVDPHGAVDRCGDPWRAPFETAALADAFRSGPVSTAPKGEAFIVASGRPTSMQREQKRIRRLDFTMSTWT